MGKEEVGIKRLKDSPCADVTAGIVFMISTGNLDAAAARVNKLVIPDVDAHMGSRACAGVCILIEKQVARLERSEERRVGKECRL